MNLSPILLFVYNRPEHTRKTIETLKKNFLAKESELIIFSDGPKNEKDKNSVEVVRKIIKNIEGFKNIEVKESVNNKGLAKSIISGVTEIINKKEKVIVLEDDLITHPYFLTYMNEALDFYENNSRIWSISGYCPPIKIPENYDKDVFLFPRASSWGWATWKNRWDLNDWEIKDFDTFIKNKKLQKEFNIGGEDMSEMLKSQIEGEIDSWAIRWCYNQFKNNMYTVFPVKSYVDNIGTDGSGTHFKTTNNKYKTDLSKSIQKINFTNDFELNTAILKNFKSIYPSKSIIILKKIFKKIKIYNLIRKIYHRLKR